MRFLFYFLIICLPLLAPTKILALEPSDFYDANGQLIEFLEPPFFDYNYGYCEHHAINRPFSSWNSTYWNIYNVAVKSLSEAINRVTSALDIPPPYYWRGRRYEGITEKWMSSWKKGFFSRYSDKFEKSDWRYNHQGWPIGYHMEYSEYVKKYEYLFYWFDISYKALDISVKRELKEKEDKYNEYSPDYAKSDIDDLKRDIARYKEDKLTTLSILNKGLEEIRALFLPLYGECVGQCNNATAMYERGRIFFDQGETINSIEDIASLIALGQLNSPEALFQLGQAYNDANQYNQAIDVLTDLIQKNPENKQAYFQRAVAYFELGNQDLALADYLSSGLKPTIVDTKKHPQLAKLSQGIALGCLKGGTDSTIDFIPSLFSTIYGLGKGSWALVNDPIGVSKEVVDGSICCFEFIKNNATSEVIAALVPELKECIEKWDHLTDEKKGYYMGYVVGRYGVDILAWGGCARGLKLYRNLKEANAMLTLESAALSGRNAKKLSLASKDFFQAREEYRKKCWLHHGQQEKHIVGANNFQYESELLLSVQELERATFPKIGTGLPARGIWGKAGYQEYVEYDKIIGTFVSEEGKVRLPTTIGKVHYNAEGGYHVVPSHPDIFKFKREKK